MFIAKSNPFAEMTQGLSGQQHFVQLEPTVDSSTINNENGYRRKTSSGWWKVILILIVLISGVGLFAWLYQEYQQKQVNEEKEVEEGNQKDLTKENK